MKYRWTMKPSADATLVENLAQSLSNKTHPSQMWKRVASLLVQRGISCFQEAKTFFRPSLEALHSPFLMKDMDKATARIVQAISQNEKILVYGDYDVDGTTAVALFYSFLLELYPQVTYYIPDRYDEGYGISMQSVDYAFDNEITLVISLDCGTKALSEIAYAREKGIDFIVCDHHFASEELPQAVAILNPKQKDCPYPYKELCGCGVGFKLVQALLEVMQLPAERAYKYLDLVALAIAADIVPITGENRTLVYYGLDLINTQPQAGIDRMLRKVTRPVSVTDLVFTLAPRINAAGRIKHGSYAVKLLTETNFETIGLLVDEVDALNQYRKDLDASITQEALLQIEQNNEQERFSTIVFNPNWHKGVIGIVAARLTETYYRPTLVFTQSNDLLVASARSVVGFDIHDALQKCSHLFEKFGGHTYAAGLSLKKENFLPFKNAFEEIVSQDMPSKLRTAEILIDDMLSLSEITPNFIHLLNYFAPFGPQNMAPVFLSKGVMLKNSRQMGKNNEHLRLEVTDETQKHTFTAVGFGLGEKIHSLRGQKYIDIVYTIEENTWNGVTSVQIYLKDVQK